MMSKMMKRPVADKSGPSSARGILAQCSAWAGTEESGNEEPIMKKPSIAQRPSAAVEDSGSKKSVRDRNKNYHFHRQLPNMPPHIQEMFAQARTKQQTQIINEIMEPSSNPREMVASWEGKQMFQDIALIHSSVH